MLNKIAFKLMSKYLVGWKKKADSDELKIDSWGVLPDLPSEIKTREEQKEFYKKIYEEFLSLGKRARAGGRGEESVSSNSAEYKKRLRDLYGNFFQKHNFKSWDKDDDQFGAAKLDRLNLGKFENLVVLGNYLYQVGQAFASMLSDVKDREVDVSKLFKKDYSPSRNETAMLLGNFNTRTVNSRETFMAPLTEALAKSRKNEFLVEDRENFADDEEYEAEIDVRISPVVKVLADSAVTLQSLNRNSAATKQLILRVIRQMVEHYMVSDQDVSANLGKNIATSLGFETDQAKLSEAFRLISMNLIQAKRDGKLEGKNSLEVSKVLVEQVMKNKEKFGIFGKIINHNMIKESNSAENSVELVESFINSLTLFKDTAKDSEAKEALKSAFADTVTGLSSDVDTGSLGGLNETANLTVTIDGVTLSSQANTKEVQNKQFGLDEEKANKNQALYDELAAKKEKARLEIESNPGGFKEYIENKKQRNLDVLKLKKEDEYNKYMTMVDAGNFTLASLKALTSNPNLEGLLYNDNFLGKARKAILTIVESALSKSPKKDAIMKALESTYNSVVDKDTKKPTGNNEAKIKLVNLLKSLTKAK